MRLKEDLYDLVKFIAVVALIIFVSLPVQAEADFTGRWEGRIEIPGQPLELAVEITEEEGAYTGVLDIPVQNAYGIKLSGIEVEGEELRFALTGLPGEPAVEAVLTGENTLEGEFSQAGMSFPLILEREGTSSAEFDTSSLDQFAEFIEDVRQNWNTPGVAVSIVTPDEVLFNQAFGYRDLEETAPVTLDTLFGIGSTSKPFTTMLLGMLVEEGKLGWDRPLTDYMDFTLQDDPLASYITARDLVSHRAGLPRYDFTLIFNNEWTQERIAENLSFMERNNDFRNSFQYSNFGYVIAGMLIEELTDMSWEEAVQTKIFDPLGIEKAKLSVSEMVETEDYSLPHLADKNFENVNQVDFWELGPAAPAGAINIGTTELNHWMQLILNKGRAEDQQLLKQGTIQQFFNSVNNISSQGSDDYTDHLGYGLGWFVSSYRGNFLVKHEGVTVGFSASVALLPEQNLGIAVLSNLNGSPVTQIITNTAVDRLLGLEEVDWQGDYQSLITQQAGAPDQSLFASSQRTGNTDPTHSRAAMVGEYSHPLYGVFQIKRTEAGLAADYYGTELTLEHWHYDVFVGKVDEIGPMELAFVFQTDLAGNISGLEIGLDVFMTNDMVEFERIDN